ncbi:family 78 glycoside hydrolase catalytic domain [Paenibacillus psychroresistens]|nr:family 78 glycoside hydrolase catalytic domain [Paenibacillus psychroresistens]
MRIDYLTCNYLKDPLGVELPKPRLSWVLESQVRWQMQFAYRIVAASSREKLDEHIRDLWDTGKVESSQSIHVAYKGQPLKSAQTVFWKVCIWDKDGIRSEWSDAAKFEMGLLDNKDWYANWIGHPSGRTEAEKSVPAPLFRKSFEMVKKAVSARVYVSGLGYYELYLNGVKIGNDVLTPGFTNYNESVLYNTYDITDQLSAGTNILGVILGNGWYNCFTSDVWNHKAAAWRDQPKFILQLKVMYDNGDSMTVGSDASWTCSESPIIFDGLRNGEFYDARLEQPGWNLLEFDDSLWKKVRIVRSPGGILKSNQMTPIQITSTIEPINLKEVSPGVWVYDLGQNISGWAQIRLSGPAGTEITIKYSEKIKQDGSIDTSNIDSFVYSGQFQTDRYTLKGGCQEEWEPRFVYHGFQYVEITGFPGTLTLENFRGRVVHTAFESRGEFECSNQLLNDIQRCARWSTLTNYHDIPTDCPHREKNGWSGDAHLSAEQTLFNFNPMSAYVKWMSDFKDAQTPSGQLPGIIPTGGWGYYWGSGPAWDSGIFLIPWNLYEYCGDTALLEYMFDSMKAYMNYLVSMADGYLVDFGLGDWCPPTGGAMEHACPTIVTDTAYFYIDAVIAAKTAKILNKYDESQQYLELADRIREAFRSRFLNSETDQIEGDCQTSLACALYMGFVNEAEKPIVLQNLLAKIHQNDMHLDCGILGTKFLLHSLSELGQANIAYVIATQTTFPSWGHWIQQGATTLWENWNGAESRNHHMFSDVSAWFYKGLAGIQPDSHEPGFKHTILRPNPVPDLDWANASHRSMYGQVACRWQVEGNIFRIKIIIPVNCHATLFVPADFKGEVLENGKVPQDIEISQVDNVYKIALGSGEYNLEIMRDKIH